jgi:hypothetical protein
MKSHTNRFIAIVGIIGLGLLMPPKAALADSESFQELSAEWQQWALSIPTDHNPQLDTTGEDCMVGQRGSAWFLAGTFGGGSATRTYAVPEDKPLYFPVINSVNINAPNVCGQGPDDVSSADLRALSAAFVDGAINLSAAIDGKAIKQLVRGRSDVFEVGLPEDNVFDAPYGGFGTVPTGIYSPAVDDGFYVRLEALKAGNHTLHIHAENPSAGFVLDVTYNLNVISVIQK